MTVAGVGTLAVGTVGLATGEVAASTLSLDELLGLLAMLGDDYIDQQNSPHCKDPGSTHEAPDYLAGLRQITAQQKNQIDPHAFKNFVVGDKEAGFYNIALEESDGSVWLQSVHRGERRNIPTEYESFQAAREAFPARGFRFR